MGKSVIGALLLLLSAGAAAYDGYGDGYAQGPTAALQDRVEQLMAYAQRNPQADPNQVFAFLDRAVAPFVDFQQMARWVAGPLARGMGPEQRMRFAAALRYNMLTALAAGLASQGIRDVRFFPPRGNPAAGDVTVGMGVAGPAGIPVKLDFRLMSGPHGWRVVDVSANGISAVAYYRNQVRQLVNQYGFEGAVARLR